MPTNKDRARWAVKQAWRSRRIAHPKSLPCFDCSKPAVEYDHYLGYEQEHWLTVQPVCRSCHHKRGFKRNERHATCLISTGKAFRDKYHLLKAFAEANPVQFQSFKESSC